MKKDKTCFFMTRLVYNFSCIILATRKRCPSDSMTGACFVFRKLIGVQWGKFGPAFWKRASQMLDFFYQMGLSKSLRAAKIVKVERKAKL